MSETGHALIDVQGLKKTYIQGKVATDALKGIDLSIWRGEYVGIVGKSGAGKTTLLNMLGGLDYISDGQVIIGDVNIRELNEVKKAQWRGRKVGVIFQSFQLIPGLNLMDNVMLPMDFCGLYKAHESAEKAKHLLEIVGLADHLHKKPSEISGGQQQRVAIARALANDPEIILADEPTGRLDSATSEVIFEIFEKVVQQGTTLIIVSHDRSLAQRTPRVIKLADGLIVEDSHLQGKHGSKW